MQGHLTIGELSRATGINPHTLRVWERRYGALRVLRLPSGHRRYAQTEVARLRAVTRALERGFRPKQVAAKSLKEIEKMLRDSGKSGPPADTADDAGLGVGPEVLEWLAAAEFFDEVGLTAMFHRDWDRRGPITFLKECAAPFLRVVGRRWAEGELTVSQEHFASEKLNDFMASQWRELNRDNTGEPFILTTLPGESHRGGIQMAAVITALAGKRVLFLGPDTPIEDLQKAVLRSRARALCLSLSVNFEPDRAQKLLTELRQRLPEKVDLVIGGEGAPCPFAGVLGFHDLDDFFMWLKTHPNNPSG